MSSRVYRRSHPLGHDLMRFPLHHACIAYTARVMRVSIISAAPCHQIASSRYDNARPNQYGRRCRDLAFQNQALPYVAAAAREAHLARDCALAELILAFGRPTCSSSFSSRARRSQ